MKSSRPHLFLFAGAAALVASLISSAATPTLIWSDEFNQPEGSGPDPAKWNYDLGGGGWGNNELETYTNLRANSYIVADPAALDGKALAIAAVKDGTNYTSARLKTQGKFSATYGRIEARLKVPNGQGMWPAFWMLGDTIQSVGWPRCGEIDVMEVVNRNPVTTYGTLHGPGYSGANGIGNKTTLANGYLSDAYHTYAVDWSPGRIAWSLDGAVYHTVTPASLPTGVSWVFDNASFFVLLNLAVGGNFPATSPDSTVTFPQLYTIDYVRVYGRPPAAPALTGAFAAGGSTIALSWRAPADTSGASVTGYRLERATDANFTTNLVRLVLGPSTSYSDVTVVPAVDYFYRVSAITGQGVSDPITFAPVRTPAALTVGGNKFINISSRVFCGTGANAAIVGFVIPEPGAKRVLLRAVGPSLTAFGLGSAEILADPMLEVHDAARGNAIIALNDNWAENANASELAAAATQLGAVPLIPADMASAALLLTLPPGTYTCVVQGKNNSTGVVLMEVYDADTTLSAAKS